MIICGKCGFTQPKDVYCANCGINLEKYTPDKPPKWVRLLKDPLSQITIAIIAAVAVFFMVINNPKDNEKTIEPVASEQANQEILADENSENEEKKEIKDEVVKKTNKISSKKIKIIQKQFAQKAVVRPTAKLALPAEKDEETQNDINNDKEEEVEAEKEIEAENKIANSKPKSGVISFYEVSPNQLDKYFTSNARVQAKVIDSSESEVQTQSFNKIPIEANWDLTKKSYTFDYMLDPIEGGDQQGIKITSTNSSSTEDEEQNINLKVAANIPNQEGSNTSIDWSRSFKVETGQSILVKIRLPESIPPSSFMEENYNSPLSIMANPQYADQKLQLLMLLKF